MVSGRHRLAEAWELCSEEKYKSAIKCYSGERPVQNY